MRVLPILAAAVAVGVLVGYLSWTVGFLPGLAGGLVLARLLHEGDDATVLSLQAQGVAGLSVYAQKSVRVTLGEALAIDGVFDRDGALHIVLDQDAQTRADFAALQIELLDLAP